MTADDLDLILQAYHSLFDLRPLLFFDEIQNIEGWEHFARRWQTRSITFTSPVAMPKC